MKKRVLIFVHINKCAGSTLEEIFIRNYGKHNIYTTLPRRMNESILRFKNYSEAKINTYSCIQGHMGFGLHSCFKDREPIYITMLRNPIHRILSLYNHTKRTPDMPIWNKGFHSKMALEEFVEKRIFFHTNNGQTRYLAAKDGLPIDFNVKEHVNREDLNRAKRHLKENFEIVGLMEEFDKTLLLLKETLGLKDVYYFKRNVTREMDSPLKIEEIPSNVVKILEAHNSLDLELFEYARQLFYGKYIQFPHINESIIDQFRKKNRRKMFLAKLIQNIRVELGHQKSIM